MPKICQHILHPETNSELRARLEDLNAKELEKFVDFVRLDVGSPLDLLKKTCFKDLAYQGGATMTMATAVSSRIPCTHQSVPAFTLLPAIFDER